MALDPRVKPLLEAIRRSRARVLDEVSGLTRPAGAAKPDADTWSIQEILEHLVLAERGGFDLMCTAAEAHRAGEPVYSGDSENDGLAIEDVVERTWKPKEAAPESATPSGKWSVLVWTSHLRHGDDLLRDLIEVLDGLPLERVIYPHFLSGPLNIIQRLEFIRFHLDRHLQQVRRVKASVGA